METDYTAYVVKLEELRRVAPDGSEYWMARDLQPLLTYETWRRFAEVVQRAQLACNSADANVRNHFAETGKMVTVGSGAQRRLDDFFLSRYACYLIAMNAKPSRKLCATTCEARKPPSLHIGRLASGYARPFVR